MYILREIEPDGLPIIVDVFKEQPSDEHIKEMRLYPVDEDEEGNKHVGEEFPLDCLDYNPRSIILLKETKNESGKEKENQ